MFKVVGEIFIPLLPGFIIAGLSAGFASLISQFIPAWRDIFPLNVIQLLLMATNTALSTYLSAWVGYSSAQRFGCTPILGGMLGMAGSLATIDEIAACLGPSFPLYAGGGGVLTVICGVFLLSRVERGIRKHMLKSLDAVLSPFLAFAITLVPYVFVCMPLLGFVTNGVCDGISFLSGNSHLAVRLVSGFVCAGLFLPATLFGIQYGFIALYAMELGTKGYISLYPVFAMAGASQVGMGIAMYCKARRVHDDALQGIAASGIIPGMLGVGAPLLYGISIRNGKAFFSSCLGAGFGGAVIVMAKIASTGWGPSGLLALPMMTQGPLPALLNMCLYVVGLGVALVCGFAFTTAFVHVQRKDE